jgi:hypothetical protein
LGPAEEDNRASKAIVRGDEQDGRRYWQGVVSACPLKPQCSPNTPSRKITRDVHEDARDLARSFVGTPEFEQSRDERKKVEMRFAHLKTHRRFERMRLRGLSGARDEFHLAAIVQNLKTLASQLWQPPPDALAASAM